MSFSFRDIQAASNAIDDGSLRIVLENGTYIGPSHAFSDLQAFAAGEADTLETYAMFSVDIDGVPATAPLSYDQLIRLAEMASQSNVRREGFKESLTGAISEIDTRPYDQCREPLLEPAVA